MTELTAGRSCPASYGYGPGVFLRAPDMLAPTLYVAGGLYGNPFALDAVEALVSHEIVPPQLIFNGDFHWFDVDVNVFADIHQRVLRHAVVRGNVETELAADDDAAGCGCGYPEDVGDDDVERSNQIIVALRTTATTALGDARSAMAALPMHLLAQVGSARIGIVHGDANSLAGWDFSQQLLDDPARRGLNEQFFRKSEVSLFASSHTCVPVLRRFNVGGRECGVINNGAAGMPNFAGTQFGLVSRISLTPAPTTLNILHQRIFRIDDVDLYVAAIALDYDHAAWNARFIADWPTGSAANLSYLQRIEQGPAWSPAQAYQSGFK